jgi:hypothetical protein
LELINIAITKELLFKQSLFRKNRGTISGFFLGGRQMFWLPVSFAKLVHNDNQYFQKWE